MAPPLRGIEALNVSSDSGPGHHPGEEGLEFDELGLDGREGALGDGVVPADPHDRFPVTTLHENVEDAGQSEASSASSWLTKRPRGCGGLDPV